MIRVKGCRLEPAIFAERREETAKSLSALVREGELDKELLPYEKFERLGAESLTDAELLSIIIRTGSGSRTPMQIGRDILSAGGTGESGLCNLYHLTLADLKRIPGIGAVKAVKLKCITELSRRMAEEKSRPRLNFSRSSRVADYYMESLRHRNREYVLMLSLNSRMNLISETILSVGTVNASLLSPREVYLEALKNNAVNIIVLHNHPGGDPEPSSVDYEVTERLDEAGRILQVRLADHLIIGDGSYFSFRDNGFLKGA